MLVALVVQVLWTAGNRLLAGSSTILVWKFLDLQHSWLPKESLDSLLWLLHHYSLKGIDRKGLLVCVSILNIPQQGQLLIIFDLFEDRGRVRHIATLLLLLYWGLLFEKGISRFLSGQLFAVSFEEEQYLMGTFDAWLEWVGVGLLVKEAEVKECGYFGCIRRALTY